MPEKGIKRLISLPYAHQQQGVAERMNRTLQNTMCKLLRGMRLPNHQWPEAMNHVVLLHNLLSSSSLPNNTSPHLLWTRKLGNTKMLRVFGCMAPDPSAPATATVATATATAAATTAATAAALVATAAPACCATMASLRSDSKDNVLLFDLAPGADTAPPATTDSATHSQWLTRDATARLAMRSLWTAQDSTGTLSAFATVENLVSHLRTSDARYRTTVPADAVAVGAARGTPCPPFFQGCSPSPLAPSYASAAAAADVSVAEDVGAASASAKRRSSKGKGGRGSGGGSGGGGGGSGSGGGGSSSPCTCPGLHLPSFSTNLVSTAALRDAMVTTTTPRGQRVSICACTRTWRHLATFTRRPGSSLYTLAIESLQVVASAQVSASGQVAAFCSCCLLSHQTLLWHHRLGHPSLPRLRGMHSRFLVSGLPRSLPPLPPSPAPPCLPCVEGRQRAAPHSSSFPPMTAPLQTLHMDVWGPARISGQGRERYFLIVVDDYTRYTTVFPFCCKGEVVDVLIHWIRTFRLQLRERFGQDLPVLRLHSHRVMEVARTSMIHAAAPHFLWPFVVRYVAHQLNLWPRVSLPETSPTLRWMGEFGDALVFRVSGSRAFVCDTSADKLSARAIPCVFLGFVPDAPGWRFYHPTSRRVLPSQDVMFDESVPFYRLFPYRSAPPPPPPLFLAPRPPPVTVGLGATRGAASGGATSGGAEPAGSGSEGAGSGSIEPGGEEPGGAEPEVVEPWGAESEGAESGVTTGAGDAGGTAAAGRGGARTRGAGATGTGGGDAGDAGAGDPTDPRASRAGGSCAGGAGA
ncbi:unnamed protein product [Closterium sp. NIES-54]